MPSNRRIRRAPASSVITNLKRGNILNMEAIGIIGMIFGLAALYRVNKLEKVLKENGVIDKGFDINK
jgi:hypothetical protein